MHSLPIGRHVLEIEGAVVTCRYEGLLSLDEVAAVHAVLESVLRERGHAYQLIDMTRTPLPDAEVRRWISQWAQKHTLECVLLFGASTPIFLMTGLLARAIHMMRADKRPVVLFERTEAEARAALARLLERRRATAQHA